MTTTNRENQLLLDAYEAGITSPKELANFMAQMTHESNDLKRLEESFRYTSNIGQIPVASAVTRKGPAALEGARIEALRGNPEPLADLMYGDRMGNTDPGDGFKYRGRGYTHLTGKDGYRAAGKALGLDLVNHPELAAEPANATKIALWYWDKNVHRVAPESVTGATRAINGGLNGLKDRQSRFGQWEQKLTPEVMAHLANGEAVLPAEALRQGARGPEVRELQAQLKAQGYMDANGKAIQIDGHFGPGTLHAVKNLQNDHGLKSDGVAGHDTLSKLQALSRGPAQTQPPLDQPAAQLDDPRHPDNALFKQALGAVHRLYAEHGSKPDQRSEQLAAALVVAARSQGMNRIDHADLSTDNAKVFLVQGALNSPFKQIASVPTMESLDTPIAQSTQALDQVAKQKASEPRLSQPSGPDLAPPKSQRATAPTMVF